MTVERGEEAEHRSATGSVCVTRRVRTSRPPWIEFFRCYDVPYALVFATFATGTVAWLTPIPIWIVVAIYLVIALLAFLVFWFALINCNPYPPGTTAIGQLRRMKRAQPTGELSRYSDVVELRYPAVLKPALCSTNSSGVALVRSPGEARAYLARTEEERILVQPLHPGEEYTIMWERWPWRARGRVVDVYWRRKTHPPGEFHPLSGSGTPKVTVDANHLKTCALIEAVEETLALLPGLHCTRLDVRADDADALGRGDFRVLESNGTVGVPGGGGVAYAFFVHWPRRIVTGLYNIARHPHAQVHPRVLVERVQRFSECGGWDFRICDAF